MLSDLSVLSMKINFRLNEIENLQNNLKDIESKLPEMVDSSDFSAKVRKKIELLDKMPSVGFMTAVTLIAEIGDFNMFKSPKALTALFGLNPSVNQSGKFTSDRNRISKRGTRFGRRILFTVALLSIRTIRNGYAINHALQDYYANNYVNKTKKVALVAVMHKLLHYIFAVLRDEKPFEFRSSKEHQA